MAKKQPSDDVSLGKFDILATYAYARAVLDGLDDDEAKQRGIVVAIMGARARLGIRKEHHEEFQAQKEAAEKKKKTTITAESFDKQVANKMGKFFEDVFLPNLKKLVEAGFSVEEVNGSAAPHRDKPDTEWSTGLGVDLSPRSVATKSFEIVYAKGWLSEVQDGMAIWTDGAKILNRINGVFSPDFRKRP